MLKLINFLDESYALQMESRLWRNQSNVAKFFKIPYVAEDIHINWLKSLKDNSPKNIAFFIKYNQEYVGVTYFHSIDYTLKVADWGIYIFNENMRGRGIGTFALSACLDFAKKNIGTEKVYLDVFETNATAKKVYEKQGFIFISCEDSFLRYEKIL